MVKRERYPICEYFEYAHLPGNLAETSAVFDGVIDEVLPMIHVSFTWHTDADMNRIHGEVAAGLRHLLEAKDCFVRARNSSDNPSTQPVTDVSE